MAGRTSSDSATCAMRAMTTAEADARAAVTSTVPLSTDTTRPSASTLATAVSVVDHAKASPSISLPSASKAVAASATVSPSEANSIVCGAIAMLTGVGNTATGTSATTSFDTAVMVVRPTLAAVTRPDSSTVATVVSPDAHATWASWIA